MKIAALTTAIGITALAAQSADAKIDRACLRGEIGKMFNTADAKRVCDPKNYVNKPDEYGWECNAESGKLSNSIDPKPTSIDC
jgi:hypothetical protein